MKNVVLAGVLCLAMPGAAIEASGDCQYVRGGITETSIPANDQFGRLLGNVTGVLNGASTVFITTLSPPTSFDVFVTTRGDLLTAIGLPTRTPVPGAPAGEFTTHVDLTITGGSGRYEAATGMLTFDGQSHNAFGGPGVATADLTYQGTDLRSEHQRRRILISSSVPTVAGWHRCRKCSLAVILDLETTAAWRIRLSLA